MSLEQPSTQEVSENIISQLEAELNQSIPLLPKSFLRVLAKALAAVYQILFKYGGYIFLQIFVQTASDQDTEVNGKVINPLINWGLLVGVGYPKAATSAELTIDVTVDSQTGSLPANSQLLSQSNGVTYLTLGAVPLDGPVISVDVIASADSNGGDGSGTQGNLDVGAKLTFANPIPQVNKEAVVTAQVVTGADRETTPLYRKRIIDRFQLRPQGGAPQDYKLWGEETEGIVAVYPYKSDNPGQVTVYVEATPESSGSADGIPTQAQMQAVMDNIEYDQEGLASRRPISALTTVQPITRTGFDIEVIGINVENEADIQPLIINQIDNYMAERAPYIHGVSVPPRKDRISDQELGGQISEILSANNGYYQELVVRKDSIAVDLYQLAQGEKAKSNTVVFL